MLEFRNAQTLFIPEEEYHARDEISTSAVKDYITAPELFRDKHVLKIIKQSGSSAAMDKGSSFHEDVLSMSMFTDYVIIPDEVLAANGAKTGNKWKEFKAANEGKRLLKASEAAEVDEMKLSLLEHPLASKLVEHMDRSVTEICVIGDMYSDDEFLTSYRMRLDYVLPGERIADLKSFHSPGERELSYRMRDHSWGIQAAAYALGADAAFGGSHLFDFVVVTNSRPFITRVESPQGNTILESLNRLEDILIQIKRRKETGNWNYDGYGERHYF